MVNAGASNDIINVGDAANSVTQVQGAVTVNGDAGADTLNFSDQPGPSVLGYHLTATTIRRDGSALVTYNTTEALNIHPSSSGESGLILMGTAATTPANWIGSGSDFMIVATPGATTTTLTGFYTGTVTGAGLGSPLQFSGLPNLVGGAFDDRYVFTDPGFAGNVDGGGGTNTLDYSPITTQVTVHLAFGYAERCGFIFQLQNIVGSQGPDLLHGDGVSNVIDGYLGDDIVVGDEGDDFLYGGPDAGFDVMIGMGGADYLEGGDGEDLLIDGYTAYDYDDVAQFYIWWERTRRDIDYYTKVDNLRTGLGYSPYILEFGTTVYSDGDIDQLYGQGDLDWFWGVEFYDITDRDPFLEYFN